MITGDDTILVLGAGPIGLALLEVSRAKGTKVYITDINEERLAAAVELGGLPLTAGDTLRDQVMSLTDGEGMPVVVEVTGNPKVMESTVELVAAGGRIVIVGLVPNGTMVGFPGLDFTRKEMTIVGSRASVDCFPESIDLLARGAIHYPEVASTFDLAQASEVFERMSGHGAPLHKAVFIGENG
jgi:L-gulonate 5-dehydrogenase